MCVFTPCAPSGYNQAERQVLWSLRCDTQPICTPVAKAGINCPLTLIPVTSDALRIVPASCWSAFSDPVVECPELLAGPDIFWVPMYGVP